MATQAPNATLTIRRPWLPTLRGSVGIVVSGAVIGVLVLIAICAPLIAPHNPNAIDLTNTVAGTSSSHLLGTDQLGRDVFSRLVYGARTSLLGALIVVVGSTSVAVPLSLIAGYRRGLLDSVLSRVWDAMFGFPTLLLAIAIVATFGPGFWTATIAVTVIYIPLQARVTRGAVLLEREKPYIAACRLQGYGQWRIVLVHILPNIGRIVGAQACLNFGYALLDLAGLTFLGFGVQAPTSDWGEMLTDGRTSLIQHSYLEVVSASIAIMVTVLAFNALGYAVANRGGPR